MPRSRKLARPSLRLPTIGALAALLAGALAGVFGVALVGFDGTYEPLVIGQARTWSPAVTWACVVRRCARGVPGQHCHTPAAFPRTQARRTAPHRIR